MNVKDGIGLGIFNNCVHLFPGPACGLSGVTGSDKYNSPGPGPGPASHTLTLLIKDPFEY